MTNVYVADGPHTIRKVTTAGVVTTVAGSAGVRGSADGTGGVARFNSPVGVIVGTDGNIYVADSGNHTIRKVTPAGVVATIAGTALRAGSADGIGSSAVFSEPRGVAVDSAGNVYVADTANNRIVKGVPVTPLGFAGGTSLIWSNGSLQMLLTGPLGSSVVVESSPDLKNWSVVQTHAILPGGANLSFPVGTEPSLFFRARLAP
jgi:DNA-binding beta-propeller fold protein YncE